MLALPGMGSPVFGSKPNALRTTEPFTVRVGPGIKDLVLIDRPAKGISAHLSAQNAAEIAISFAKDRYR